MQLRETSAKGAGGHHGAGGLRRLTTLGLSALLALGTVALPATGAGAVDGSIMLNGITYTASAGSTGPTAVVSAFDGGTTQPVILPAVTIDGKELPVTTIGQGAFNAKGITGVTLPESVTSLADLSFAFNSLSTLELPDSLTTVGAGAFLSNPLTEVTLGDSIISVESMAFARNNLREVRLPDSLAFLGAGAFHANALEHIAIPGTLQSVGDQAFADNRLRSVEIAEGTTEVGERAFHNNWISSLKLPETLNTIGASAFQSNVLTTLAIPAGVRSIGSSAFASNIHLATVSFAGAAPTIAEAGETGSFDIASGKTFFVPRAELAPGTANGFTIPTWMGYDTLANSHIVTFDTGGGSEIAQAEVAHEGMLTMPTTPTRTGHEFTGWFMDATTEIPFDEHQAIIADITLYAGWAPEKHTVTFVTGEGSHVAPAVVADGETLTLPPEPHRDGHEFNGWFLDSDLHTPFVESTPVHSNLTLHAAWFQTTLTDGWLTYQIHPYFPERGAMVTEYAGPSGIALTIPDTIRIGDRDYPVTVIDELVFDSAGLTEVALPNTLVEISDFAFWQNNFAELIIPASVRHIGLAAFAENPIERLQFEEGIETIGHSAFVGSSLHELTLPASLKEIDGRAFGDTHILTSITFLGPAPEIIPTDPELEDGESGSFGKADGKTLFVRSQHLYPKDEGGFTMPTWMGYTVKLMPHTVTFETAGGSALDAVTVDDGATLTLPADPTFPEFEFAGWYLNAEHTELFNDEQPILSDMTLFARWTPVIPPIEQQEVTPVKPAQTGAVVSIPEIEGVEYADSSGHVLRGDITLADGEKLTVVASPAPGYIFAEGAITSWSFTYAKTPGEGTGPTGPGTTNPGPDTSHTGDPAPVATTGSSIPTPLLVASALVILLGTAALLTGSGQRRRATGK